MIIKKKKTKNKETRQKNKYKEVLKINIDIACFFISESGSEFKHFKENCEVLNFIYIKKTYFGFLWPLFPALCKLFGIWGAQNIP